MSTQVAFAVSRALEEAFARRRPVLLFSAWAALPALPVAVGRLLLSMPGRQRSVPLNPCVGFFPWTGVDNGAFETATLTPERVQAHRRRARTRRAVAGSALPGDLGLSDWEYAIQKLDGHHRERRVGISSFMALDSVQTDGELRLGARPLVGNRVRRGEPRLPRCHGLHVSNASSSAVEQLARCDLLLLDLQRSQGRRTESVCLDILDGLNPSKPSIVLAETSADVELLSSSTAVAAIDLSVQARALRLPSVTVAIVARERAQDEQQFRYALPPPPHAEGEEELIRVAEGAWRALWRGIDAVGALSLVEWFRSEVREVGRRREASAARFNMVSSLFERLEATTIKAVREERRAALVRALETSVELAAGPTTVIVASGAERDSVLRALDGKKWRPWVRVLASRHAASRAAQADTCVVVGHCGRATLDAVLRADPLVVTWVLDPVEAVQIGREATWRANAMARLSLDSQALQEIGRQLLRASGGVEEANGGGGPSVMTPVGGDGEGQRWKSDGGMVRRRALVHEVLDPHPSTTIYLADGSAIRVDAGRRFDVVPTGSFRPEARLASEVRPGDQLLVVRGDYQRTLSELLLEDMDTDETKAEAAARTAWASLCRSFMKKASEPATVVAARVRALGGHATAERVRAWMTGDSTPRDWRTFHCLAEALELALPEEALRHMFMTIKRWRVAHRLRGREVVRLCRKAWFGGLSAADLARIQARWGLTARDLVEGSRIVEVEAIETAPGGDE